MKKTVSVAILLLTVFLASDASFAAERGTPEYERLKEYKRQQRENKVNSPADPQGKAKGFWAKEASRSGLAGTAAMFGGAIGSAVPFEKPNSRKNQVQQ